MKGLDFNMECCPSLTKRSYYFGIFVHLASIEGPNEFEPTFRTHSYFLSFYLCTHYKITKLPKYNMGLMDKYLIHFSILAPLYHPFQFTSFIVKNLPVTHSRSSYDFRLKPTKKIYIYLWIKKKERSCRMDIHI